ncbi:MAG TPA: polysaccharide biosynthesis tyrosine autokinase [Gemmatimonadaceae bacterium]
MPQYLPSGNRRPLPAVRAASAERRWAGEPDDPEPTLAPLDLRQILAMLRRRMWLVIAATVLSVAGAAYLAVTSNPIYQANAVVQLTDSRRALTGGLVDPTAERPTLSSDPILSEIAVLTSRAVVGKVVDSIPTLRIRAKGFSSRLLSGFVVIDPAADSAGQLPTLTLAFGANAVTVTAPGGARASAPYGSPMEIGGMRFAVASRPRAEGGTLSVIPVEDAAARLAASIKAKPRPNTNIVDVSYASTDPLRAQHVLNMLVRVFEAASVEDAAQEARLRRQFVESQLKQNDSVLTAARQMLSDFRSRQRSYSTREKFTAQRSDLSGIESQQATLDAQRRLYASVLRQLQNGSGRDGLQQIGALLSAEGASASPIVMDQYVSLQRLQNTRDSLTTGRWASSQTNPDVQRVDELMSTARSRLQRTVEQIVATLDDRRTSLGQLKARNSAELVQIPATDAEEARLVEREEAFRKIGDQLRDELQRTRLAEAATVGQVQVIDLATRPRLPIGTSMTRKMLYGLLLGLFLGTGAALVTEHLNSSIRGRDDLETVLQLPGLAVIPKFSTGGRKRRLSRHGARRALNGGGKGNGGGSGGGGGGGGGQSPDHVPAEEILSDALVSVRDARSVSAEAYRTLRTKLLFSRAISSLKTIVVTSPFAQDGKSTVAANLAVTFAQHGLRVLLIDCDLRRPTQHEVFQLPCEPGLTELLTGDGLVAGTGRRTSVEGLSLITAGTLPGDPAELVGSTRFRDVLTRLQESFDVIVIDSPPVLPVADASILASLADGVLLVVRAGQTNRRAAQLAVQQLQEVEARILGAVLNDPKSQVPGYDQYGYASYYGYGKE